MAQIMKVDGEKDMWTRQVSTASTELPSSPAMSRMVSRESDHNVVELTGKMVYDSVATELDSLPNWTHSTASSRVRLVLVPVLCGFFIYGLMNSLIVLILTGALIFVLNSFTLHQAWPKDPASQNQDKMAASSSLGQIIGSFYGFFVHASIFGCIAALAILSPWALLLLPAVYICLIDDQRTEDCEDEDDESQSVSVAPEILFSNEAASLKGIWKWAPSFQACICTIVFVLVAVMAIVAILLPAALVFSLKD